jgi:anti-anti-sigma factor
MYMLRVSAALRNVRDPLQVTVRADEDWCRLEVAGELDMATMGVLRDELARLRAAHRQMVVDLSGLSFVDSSGLRLLLEAQADARRDGWGLAFSTELSPAVKRLLDLTATWELLSWREAPR